MSFPRVSAFVGNFICLAPGVLFFIMGLGFGIHSLRERRAGRPLPNDPPIPVLLGFILIGGVITAALGSTFLTYLSTRFDPTAIVEIRVEHIAREDSPPSGPPIVVADRNLLVAGFTHLTSATSHLRNHESYSDGYRIQIRLQGESSYGAHTIRVYRRTSRSNQPAVIVTMMGAGEYNCPAFHQWIHATIDPLFQSTSTTRPSTMRTVVHYDTAAQPAHGDDRPPSHMIPDWMAACHPVGSHGPP
jgi:hypothetical protein